MPISDSYQSLSYLPAFIRSNDRREFRCVVTIYRDKTAHFARIGKSIGYRSPPLWI